MFQRFVCQELITGGGAGLPQDDRQFSWLLDKACRLGNVGSTVQMRGVRPSRLEERSSRAGVEGLCSEVGALEMND